LSNRCGRLSSLCVSLDGAAGMVEGAKWECIVLDLAVGGGHPGRMVGEGQRDGQVSDLPLEVMDRTKCRLYANLYSHSNSNSMVVGV
jgi:hypothetical protein